MNNVNNIEIAKVQPQGVALLLSIYLIFCQFHPAVPYKSVAYKKSV